MILQIKKLGTPRARYGQHYLKLFAGETTLRSVFFFSVYSSRQSAEDWGPFN